MFDIPYDIILKIMISQLFLYAANNIIELLRELIYLVLANIYVTYSNNTVFWKIYKLSIKNIITCILFLLTGIILTLILNELNKNKPKG